MSFVGDKFVKIRKDFELTQKQFAEAIGISQGRLSEIEKGKNSPSYDTMLLIKKKFNINMDYFFDIELSDVEYSKPDNSNKETSTFCEIEDIVAFLNTNINEGKILKEDLFMLVQRLQEEIGNFPDQNAIHEEYLNDYEVELIEKYRQLPERDQGRVDQFIDSLLPKGRQQDDRKKETESSNWRTGRDETSSGDNTSGRGIA